MSYVIRSIHGRVLQKGDSELPGADLCRKSLMQADLRGVDLRSTSMRYACMEGADLRGADLTGAVLEGAFLEDAKLSGATLTGCDFSFASLDGADIDGIVPLGAGLGVVTGEIRGPYRVFNGFGRFPNDRATTCYQKTCEGDSLWGDSLWVFCGLFGDKRGGTIEEFEAYAENAGEDGADLKALVQLIKQYCSATEEGA